MVYLCTLKYKVDTQITNVTGMIMMTDHGLYVRALTLQEVHHRCYITFVNLVRRTSLTVRPTISLRLLQTGESPVREKIAGPLSTGALSYRLLKREPILVSQVSI